MKKLNFILVFCLAMLTFAQAQIPPQAFNYSAVARNAAGQPIATATIGIQISILKSSALGQVMYAENHFVNTDAFGLFNLIVGGGATQSGSMNSIDWSNDDYYLKVGMDANGGTNFLTMGTTQLLSVPYALHAATADSIVGIPMDGSETVIIAGNDVTITGSGTAADPYIVNASGPTGNIPVVSTGNVIEILETFGGGLDFYLKVPHVVSSDGGETILSRGVCYSTSPNPTTSGSGTQYFNNWIGADTSQFNVEPNTTYYIRAFAVNARGTAYGNEVSFTTTDVQLATIQTNPVSDFSITYEGTVLSNFSAQLLDDGGQPPLFGFCYATSPNPTLNDIVLNTYTSTTTSITLQPNTTYYVRAYATNSAGTAFGNQVTFTTPQLQLATVVTDPITDLYPAPGPSYYTYFSGSVSNNGGWSYANITGFCYSTSPNPTISDNIVIPNGGFAGNLPIGQTFYVRAYTTTPAGTAYGNEVVFSTPGITVPEVVTNPVINIQSTSATLNGEINNSGNDLWNGSDFGFVVSINPNPTISDLVFSVGNVEGAFSFDAWGLEPATTYYVRAYGVNSAGEGYGNQVVFITAP